MIKTILVPLDGSALAEAALPQAERVAQRAGGSIVLVRAVHGGVMAPAAQSAALADAELYLQAVTDDVASHGCRVRHDAFVAEPAEGILLAAQANKADVLVMSTHGFTGLRHALLGSVAEEVLRQTDLPVLLVQPGRSAGQVIARRDPFRKILVPLDRTPGAERALRLVAEADFTRAAEILLVHSEVPVPLPGANGGYPFAVGSGLYIPQALVDEADQETETHCRSARQYLERLAHTYLDGRSWRIHVPIDDPGHAIVSLATEQHADLIVMTTHARTGLARLAEGSVAAHVLRHAGVPVLLMRQTAGIAVAPAPITAGPAGVDS